MKKILKLLLVILIPFAIVFLLKSHDCGCGKCGGKEKGKKSKKSCKF
jgi:hypothetical protein